LLKENLAFERIQTKFKGMRHSLSLRETARDARNDHSFFMVMFVPKVMRKECSFNMRVISGSARGRRLKEPAGFDIRPTSDKVKESIFNIIQFDIEGRKVLDLFAGTGQLGIEALSRGAARAVFVDTKADAIKLIWSNLKHCKLEDSAQVLSRDALRFLESDEKYDLIIIDPPYDSDLAEKSVEKIIEFDKLNANGIIICEINAERTTPDVPKPYFLHKEYKYGTIKILRYEREITD